MFQTAAQGIHDVGAYGKIEIGDPKRSDVVAAEHQVKRLILHGTCAVTVDHLVEIISISHGLVKNDDMVYAAKIVNILV